MIKFLAVSLVLLAGFAARAATNTAASASYADVNAAIASSANGDTVNVPAGSATWNTMLNISGKSIQLIGAGSNSTIITVGTVNRAINWSLAATNFVRISSFGFRGSGTDNAPSVMDMNGISTTESGFFRVDHCTFSNLTDRGISTYHQKAGLIDHCYFHVPNSATCISPDAGQPNFTDDQWNRAASYYVGTTNCIVAEDNAVNFETSIVNGTTELYGGMYLTFRYNTCTNGDIGGHGTDSGGILRGGTGAEVYMNRLYQNINGNIPYSYRGGSIQIWSNQIVNLAGATSPQNSIILNQYRGTGTNVYYPSVCCSPFGAVSGTNRYDGNLTNGWPGMDQIGMIGPTTTNAGSWTQVQSPCYFWGNTTDGTNNNIATIGQDDANTGPYAYISRPSVLLVKNRDWYEGTAKPGYTPLVYPHPIVTAQDGGGGGSGNIANVGTLNKR